MNTKQKIHTEQVNQKSQKPPLLIAPAVELNPVTGLSLPIHPTTRPFRQAAVLQLQHKYGNNYVQRTLKQGRILTPSARPRLIQRQFEDEGRTDEGPVEGVPIEEEAKTAALTDGEVNQWGEEEGILTSDVFPHVFVDGGKTGSDRDNTVGGRGGTGNQSVAAITLVAPVYESAGPAGGVGAKAWIRSGTGTARVVRSYTGSLVGANGPTLYMTAAAVTRTDQHEQLHVNSSRAIHNTHIVPLEGRITSRTGRANALVSGTTTAAAVAALQAFINWNTTIAAFRRDDTAANTPMGTIDTTDLASPTFIRDYGPRTVGRVRYAHYFDVPPGPGGAASP